MNSIVKDILLVNDVITSLSQKGVNTPLFRAKDRASWNFLNERIGDKLMLELFTRAFASNGSWLDDYNLIFNSCDWNSLYSCEGKDFIKPFVEFVKKEVVSTGRFSEPSIWEHVIGKFENVLWNYAGAAIKAFTPNSSSREVKTVADSSRNIIASFYNEYPVLARIFTSKTLDLLAGTRLFLNRLEADFDLILPPKNVEDGDSCIVSVVPANSDVHTYEGEVLIVCFNSGRKIVYKPKSPCVEKFINNVMIKINELGAGKLFHFINFIARENYFWQEYIRPEYCNEERDSILEEAGKFIALSNLLLLEDYHLENIRISNGHFWALDNEIVCSPLLKIQMNHKFINDAYISKSLFYSVYNHKLIPDLFLAFFNDFEDNFGLKVLDANYTYNDSLHIIKGFLKVHEVFKKNEKRLIAYLIAEMQTVEKSRYLIRYTSYYYTLIQRLCEPETLKNSITFYLTIANNILNGKSNSDLSSYSSLLSSELNELTKFNIPAFYFSLNNVDSFLDGAESGHHRFQIQLKNWSDPNFINSQIEILNRFFSIDGNCFLKNMRNSHNHKWDYEGVAIDIAKGVAFLYNNVFYLSHFENVSLEYLGLNKGILGTALFLAVAAKKTMCKEIEQARDKLFALCEAVLISHVNDLRKMEPVLISEIAYGLEILDEFCMGSSVRNMRALLISVLDINCNAVHNKAHHIENKNLRELCDKMLENWVNRGFLLENRNVNPYIEGGYAGVGLTLFGLGDPTVPIVIKPMYLI